MAKNSPTNQIDLFDLIKKAVSVQNGPDIYCNHAQIHVSINDMIIDLYLLSPEIGDQTQVKATHVQRVIIPLNMAKGLAGAILDSISRFEQDTHLVLPDTRSEIPPEPIQE